MAQVDYEKLQNKLIAFRETEGISSREKMAAMLGLTFSCYNKIEQGDRRPSRETLAAMMRYFQSIEHAEMVLALLRCIDTDPEALHQQLELAAWLWLPELPERDRLIQYIDKGNPRDGLVGIRGRLGRFWEQGSEWGREPEDIACWRYLNENLPLLQGGNDD